MRVVVSSSNSQVVKSEGHAESWSDRGGLQVICVGRLKGAADRRTEGCHESIMLGGSEETMWTLSWL